MHNEAKICVCCEVSYKSAVKNLTNHKKGEVDEIKRAGGQRSHFEYAIDNGTRQG
jgi:hypothetical protein